MDEILVLLATYNGEKYLREQLDSIFAQEGVAVSVLARDDGSSDDTKTILEEYRNKAKLNWYTGEHLNVQKGYMDLLQRAAQTDYEFFAFSDQDDVWDKDKLEIGIKTIKEKRIPALYYCGQRLVDGNLIYIEEHKMNPYRSDYARFMLNDVAGCTEVFNRHLLDTVVTYTPSYMLMHDTWLLKVCLAVGGEICVDCDCHMSYRQHGNNVMGLKRDLKSKLLRVRHYINEQKVEPQMRELSVGFQDRLVNNYKEIIEDTLNYKRSLKSRLRLLNRKKFNFADGGVQSTYILKILLNRL